MCQENPQPALTRPLRSIECLEFYTEPNILKEGASDTLFQLTIYLIKVRLEHSGDHFEIPTDT